MNAFIVRSCLASGVAVASVAGFVLAPAAPQVLLARPKPAVALTAHVEPLAAQTPSALVHRLPDLVNQQVTFHVAFVADFVATGAVLVDRQLQIPGTLVRDIQNGTPLPVAVGRALQTFVEIELDAGRELIGFAVQYVDFQIRFIAQVVEDVITASASALAAVGDVITPKVAAVTRAPSTRLAEAMSERVAPSQPSDTAPDNVTETRMADSARPTMSLSTPDDKITVSAQGEIRSGSTKTTSPVAAATSNENAPAQRDDAIAGADQSEPTESEQHQPDTTETDQHQTDAASGDGDTSNGSESAAGDE